MEFSLLQDLESDVMKEFIAFCRFITFNGDIDDLVEASGKALD